MKLRGAAASPGGTVTDPDAMIADEASLSKNNEKGAYLLFNAVEAGYAQGVGEEARWKARHERQESRARCACRFGDGENQTT
jgi:hypothetical protein